MTIYRSDDCASGIHEYCSRCQCSCHGHEFSIEEIKAIYEVLEKEYISYEKELAHETLRKMQRIINGMAG